MRGGSSREVVRHLRTLYQCGVAGSFSDEQLLERFLARRDETARGGVRRAGAAARADGAGRLPPHPGRCARGGGRLPGDVPGPGPEGGFGRASREGRELALRRRRPHGEGGPRPGGPATGQGGAREHADPRRAARRGVPGRAARRSWTRSSPGCRRGTGGRWSSASSRACLAPRRPDGSASPRARSPAGWRGPRPSCATAWPVAASVPARRRSRRPSCSARRRPPPCPSALLESTVEAATLVAAGPTAAAAISASVASLSEGVHQDHARSQN